MPEGFLEQAYNPDVLSCLANLSNDEVFTPPEVVNSMLDMLPQELFENPDTTFLDPACKTGVFLREIAKRLIKGLEPQMPDLQERLDHIFHKQLFGIAITELTSLLSRRGVYCSKYPGSDFSVSRFDDEQGNIRYKNILHTWVNGKCKFCGISQSTILGKEDRGDSLETHAYEWIHIAKPEETFNMKFDVIIGNPPYQLDDGGNGASASPIYQKFIEQAKKLNPRFLSMIIPARWYSGGKGLDVFRAEMLNDSRISHLVDYTNSADCFPGVDVAGGICYFLWDRDYCGDCAYTNIFNGKTSQTRKKLNEYSTFIRYPMADSIVHKVHVCSKEFMNTMISTRKPFGLATNVKPIESGELTLRYNGGRGPFPISRVTTGREFINDWKVLISYLSAEHAGQPDKSGKFRVLSTMEVLAPKEICTETYLLAGIFNREELASNLLAYLKTKFVRFLVAQVAVSQHITKDSFRFVPKQDFNKTWNDELLYKKYNLTQEEISFIEDMIKPYDGGTADAE